MNAVLGGTIVVGSIFVGLNLLSRPAVPAARSADARDGAGAMTSRQASRSPDARRARACTTGSCPTGRTRGGRRRSGGRTARGARSRATGSRWLGLLIVLGLVLDGRVRRPARARTRPTIGDLRTTRLLPPSAAHWFGTDDQGRDILSRLIHGSRITLFVVVLVAVLAAPIGLAVGTVAGYAGGSSTRR